MSGITGDPNDEHRESDIRDPSDQHHEGIEHLKSNTATPTENREMESRPVEHSTAGDKFVSPLVPTHGNDHTTSQSTGGGVMGSVKSYLGMGTSTAGQTVETGQLGSSELGGRNVEDHTIVERHPSGVEQRGVIPGVVTGQQDPADMERPNEIGLGRGSGAGLESTRSTSGVGRDSAISSAAPVEAVHTERNSSAGLTTGEKVEEKVEENTSRTGSHTGEGEVTSGESEHKPPKPADGRKMENESSIPTAGGERLGEKHWGESKIVPDDPTKKRGSAAGVTSDDNNKETSDNTAKNTGGAKAPSDSSNNKEGNGGEEKPSTIEKIKEKLHM